MDTGRQSHPAKEAPQPDLAEHERTFHMLVKGMFLFAAHVVVILLVLDVVFL